MKKMVIERMKTIDLDEISALEEERFERTG